jgi:hypothetical protein
MTDTARLTLAFVGEQEVHRNNARALLDDFVDGWLKQHRKGEVKVILARADTDTMSDLDDWANTSGYDVSEEPPEGIVPALLEEPDARLILVGDPNEDDTLYDVTEEAAKYRIHTRSLINGLEKVVFDDDDFDDDLAGDGFHEVDVESGEGWVEDDDLTDEAAKLLAAVPDVEDAPDDDAPPDLDILATLADDGQVEAQEEIKDLAAALDIDVAPFETWVDAVEAIRSKQAAEFYEDPGNMVAGERVELVGTILLDPPISVDDDPTPGDIPTSETGVSAPTPSSTAVEDVPPGDGDLTEELSTREADDFLATTGSLYTREQLEAKSFDEVKAIGLDYGIAPGRGMKHGVYVNKILLASGVETEPPKRKRNRKKLEAVAEPVEEVVTVEAGEGGATVTQIIVPRPVTFEKAVLETHIRMLRGMADELELLLKD